jgi:hypothetical protein
MNKRLFVTLVVVVGIVILLRTYSTQVVVSQCSATLDASKLKDWIPGSSEATRSRGGILVHPITKLMVDAQTKFNKMITGQSETLAEAVREYKRRYGRNPPKGFDEWFEFAKENGVKIIDDYDQIVRDLEPFWGMSGEELRRRTVQVRVLFAIRGSQAELSF